MQLTYSGVSRLTQFVFFGRVRSSVSDTGDTRLCWPAQQVFEPPLVTQNAANIAGAILNWPENCEFTGEGGNAS